jgi:hypothetical protein
MIPNKLQSLFEFFDFLHANIDTINQHSTLLLEISELESDSKQLKPKENIIDKEKHEKISKLIESKTEIINSTLLQPILSKFNELEIGNWYDILNSIYDIWMPIITNCKTSIELHDKEIIQNYENKYLNFIASTPLLFNKFILFRELENILGDLFKYINPLNDKSFKIKIEEIRTKSQEKYHTELRNWEFKKDPIKQIELSYFNNYEVIRDSTYSHNCKIKMYLNKGSETRYLPISEFSEYYQKYVIGQTESKSNQINDHINFIKSEKEKLTQILKSVKKHDTNFSYNFTQFNEYESNINSAISKVESLVHIQSIMSIYTPIIDYKPTNINQQYESVLNDLSGFKIDNNEVQKELETIDTQNIMIKMAMVDHYHKKCMPIYVAITTLSKSETFELDYTNTQYDQLIKTFEILNEKIFGNTDLDKSAEFNSLFVNWSKTEIINTQPEQEPEIIEQLDTNIEETAPKHPPHDPNLWSEESYGLFKYLKEKYHTKTIKQITNIWFYLKNNADEKFKCNCTKDDYKAFIKKYGINITNFDKSTKYDSNELGTMNNHTKDYKNSLKEIAKH